MSTWFVSSLRRKRNDVTFSDTSQLRIAERWLADGTCEPTWLEVVEGVLSLRIEGGSPIEIPLATFESVMRRYGKPLADDVTLHGARLVLPAGRSVVLLRYLSRYDVIAKDYLVYSSPDAPPLAELAGSITAALLYLARADL